MKGKFNLEARFDKITTEQCFISEITLAELKFGIEKSEKPEKNKRTLDNFLTGVQILPLFSLIGLYGRQSQEIAEKLIQADLIDFVSSDIHKPDQLVYLRDVLKSPALHKLIKSESLLNHKL